MQLNRRQIVTWGLAALLPFILFLVARSIYLATPTASYNALLVAMETKDEPEIKRLATPPGFEGFKNIPGGLCGSYLDCWQHWATIEKDTGSMYCVMTGPNTCKFRTRQTAVELKFVKTSDGWKLNEVRVRA